MRFLIDEIRELARYLGVDDEIPMSCLPQCGYLYSAAAFILARIEEELGTERSNLTLGERFENVEELALKRRGRELGFDENPGTSFGRTSIKRSHRAEGFNYVD
jgi:hypothetical protein